MQNSQKKFSGIVLALLIVVFIFEILRGAFTNSGDFYGYVLVGNYVLSAENIYTNPLINTWPPFFALFAVPIAILDNFNPQFIRFVWLTSSVVAIFYIYQIILWLSLGKKFTIQRSYPKDSIHLNDWVFLIPLLLSLRFILDNLANVQINIFILLLCIVCINLFEKRKILVASLVLALGISIKIYPIFVLLYFLIKGQGKMVLFTFGFCILFVSMPFFVFGLEKASEYYIFWYTQNVEPFASVAHKNQSYFSMMRSLLTHESPGINQPLNKEIYVNIINLPLASVQRLSYVILFLFSLPVIYIFNKTHSSPKPPLKRFIEYAFVLSLTPILSPLAWKAFFIFLLPGYFLNYLFLFRMGNSLRPTLLVIVKVIFYLFLFMTIFSSELFVGKYVSDLFETFSFITIGTILMCINLLIFYLNFSKFEEPTF